MTGLDFQKLSSEKQKINYMKNSKYKREKGHLAQEPCGLKNRASSNFWGIHEKNYGILDETTNE